MNMSEKWKVRSGKWRRAALFLLLFCISLFTLPFTLCTVFAQESTQVPVDWNATSGIAAIKNKPNVSGVTWPSGTGIPGIANGALSATLYNASNQIPFTFLAGVQPLNANLTTFAGIAPSANAQTLMGHTFAQMLSDIGAQAAGSYAASNASTTVNGQTCTLGSSCTVADANAIHGNASGEIAALTVKTTPATNDLLVIEDSAASNAKKKVTVGSFLMPYFNFMPLR